MSHSEAVQIPSHSRRPSIFDAGGPNSINEFAHSYSRIQAHLQNIIVHDEADSQVSPRFSFADDAAAGHYGATDSHVVDGSVFHDDSFMSAVDGELGDQQLLLARTQRLYSINSRITAKVDDGTVIVGRSTSPQTVFNSINILIGVALYSLSYGFKYSGLIYGTVLLVLSGLVTDYSAVLIGRCLKKNTSLFSYGDIAQYCYGNAAYMFVVGSFSLDLIGAFVALVILFSDSFSTFFPAVSKLAFRLLFCLVILVLSLLPLSVLANLSFVGIVCTTGSVLVCIVAGLTKPAGQGSLLTPSDLYLWPAEYKNLLVSLGIFLALFGGHAVFPELYRDMRHPQKFSKSITVAFSFTIGLDLTCALVGYIMFGNAVDEILTNSILKTPGYPSWIGPTLCFFLGTVPLTKGPLVIRPVANVLDQIFQVHTSRKTFHPIKVLDKAVIIAIALAIATLCSSFAQVMAVMGSLICFTICITLPFMFYYKMFYQDLGRLERRLFQAGIATSIVLTFAGTYAAIKY